MNDEMGATGECRTCGEPTRAAPHCPDCEAYWAQIDRAIKHAKIEASVRRRAAADTSKSLQQGLPREATR